MRYALSSILVVFLLLPLFGMGAEVSVPSVSTTTRLPNIKASINDGFYSLAEQQARGVLRNDPKEEEAHEATLLLCHALWGQKRYSEILGILRKKGEKPEWAYWRARAHFELKDYNAALRILIAAEALPDPSPYAPEALRLKCRIEQLTDQLASAEASCLQFAEEFPNHPEALANQFDLAEIYTLQNRSDEAEKIYATLIKTAPPREAQRAQIKLAHLLHLKKPIENPDQIRGMLLQLATNKTTELAFQIDAYIELADLENNLKNPEAAIQAFRQAIKLSPDARQRVPLKIALARMLLAQNQTDPALKLLEECRAEAPNETIAAELQLEKASALLQAKQFTEANDAFQIYLDVADNPDGLARAYFGKGLALWNLKRFTESAAAFDKATKGLPNNAQRQEALFKAGDAYFQANNYSEAAKRYRTFSSDFPENPLRPHALYQLGLALSKSNHEAEATEVFQSIETDYPQSTFAEKAALRSADLLINQAQWEAALNKYTQIAQTYTNAPTVALSLQQRGLLLYRLGRYSEAQTAFTQLINKYPKSEYTPQASYMRGFCLYYQGHLEESLSTARKFIEEYPDSEWTPEVLFWLAEQYFNRGEYSEANSLFLRIASTYPSTALAPQSLYWAGRAEAKSANYVRAIELFGKIAKTYPKSLIIPQARFAQGDALTELGEFARAILAFDEIIKNYPENDLVNPAWGRKGDCQFALASDNPSRYAEALKSYQTILDRPTAPLSLKLQAEYKLGRCFEKMGEPEKAFNRYMNVVYTFINQSAIHSPANLIWFTRSAFGAATIKERNHKWMDAVHIYQRVIEAQVPAQDEATKRIEKIKKENWLLFQRAKEEQHVGSTH